MSNLTAIFKVKEQFPDHNTNAENRYRSPHQKLLKNRGKLIRISMFKNFIRKVRPMFASRECELFSLHYFHGLP